MSSFVVLVFTKIRFDDAVRMVGLCCSGAYDFNVDRLVQINTKVNECLSLD